MLTCIGVIEDRPQHLIPHHRRLPGCIDRSALADRPVEVVVVRIIGEAVPVQFVDLERRVVRLVGAFKHRAWDILVGVFCYSHSCIVVHLAAYPDSGGIQRRGVKNAVLDVLDRDIRVVRSGGTTEDTVLIVAETAMVGHEHQDLVGVDVGLIVPDLAVISGNRLSDVQRLHGIGSGSQQQQHRDNNSQV